MTKYQQDVRLFDKNYVNLFQQVSKCMFDLINKNSMYVDV